jgi:hypothetical protein
MTADILTQHFPRDERDPAFRDVKAGLVKYHFLEFDVLAENNVGQNHGILDQADICDSQ